MKEIKVTESYLGLDETVRKCQNVKSLHDCTTKQYIDAILENCGCLPAKIKRAAKVIIELDFQWYKSKSV